jgi:hypothetical protein
MPFCREFAMWQEEWYNKLRCFAFNVKTNPAYEVSPNGAEDEILLRLKALVDAVQRLQHLLADRGLKEPNTLHLLMAPEFFFRPENGAYNFPNLYRMGLQQAFSAFGAPWSKNWLVVCGTIITATPSTITQQQIREMANDLTLMTSLEPTIRELVRDLSQRANLPADLKVGFNTALASRGAQQGIYEIIKRHVSHIDGMDQYLKGSIEAYIGNNVAVADYWQINPASMVNALNVSLGVEVCLDHAIGMLRQSGSQPDVHLITACGMPVEHANAVGTKAVFRVDGQCYTGRRLVGLGLARPYDPGLRIPSPWECSTFGIIPPSTLLRPDPWFAGQWLGVQPIYRHDFTTAPGQNFIAQLRRPVSVWEYPPVDL